MPLTFPLRTARVVARLALLLLGTWAVVDLATAEHVREFQAGAMSTGTERLWAILQRSALETLGFGLTALALGAVAWLATPLRGRGGGSAARFAGTLAVTVAAFGIWSVRGAYYAGEYLPYLSARELLLLNLGGFGALLIGALLHDRLVGVVARGVARGPGPRGVGAGLALVLGATLAEWVRAQNPGRDLELAGLLVASVGSIPLGALLAHVLGRPIERWLDAPTFALPRGAARALDAVLILVLVGGLSQFSFGGPPADPAPERLTSAPEGPGPNVVYVVVDTLRADALGSYGYPRPTSPFLDRIAADGVRFADFSSAAPWTKPSTGSLLTGLYPSRHGALHHGSRLRVPEGEQALAEVFQSAGYATAAFVTNPNVKAVFEFDRGFDQFHDAPVEDTVSMAALRDSWFGRLLIQLTRYQFNWKYANDARAMNARILPWIRAHADERFFLYLHYIDPHSPYDPPAEYRHLVQDHGLVLHNERKRLVGRDLYDAEIRYMDDQLEALVETLRESGVWEDTLFVLTSDHGEEWYEFDVLGHGYSLYQPVVGVPLILHGPSLGPGLVVRAPTQMVDLPATLVDLAGLGRTELGDGRSFAPAARSEPWNPREVLFLENEFGMDQDADSDFVHRAVRSGRWKLVETTASAYRPPERGYPEVELYDVQTDPEERNDLAGAPEHETLIEELRGTLALHAQFLESSAPGADTAPIDEATRRQLEALGYVLPSEAPAPEETDADSP